MNPDLAGPYVLIVEVRDCDHTWRAGSYDTLAAAERARQVMRRHAVLNAGKRDGLGYVELDLGSSNIVYGNEVVSVAGIYCPLATSDQ